MQGDVAPDVVVERVDGHAQDGASVAVTNRSMDIIYSYQLRSPIYMPELLSRRFPKCLKILRGWISNYKH
jgi:hypothetical protein